MFTAAPIAAPRPNRPRSSPNRRREIARMVFWNLVIAAAVVTLPILF